MSGENDRTYGLVQQARVEIIYDRCSRTMTPTVATHHVRSFPYDSPSGSDVLSTEAFNTLPAMLQYVTGTYHNAHCLNGPEGGEWVHYSSEMVACQVRRMALGLVALGVKCGQSVGILADSSPWWVMVDLAIQVAGGVSVPLFPNSTQTNLKFKIKDADIRVVFVSDKMLASRFHVYRRLFSKVILRGTRPKHEPVMGCDALERLGDKLSVKQPKLFGRLCNQVDSQDLATIIYTSGTNGIPKGVRLTQHNLVSQIQAASQRFEVDCVCDRALSVLPLAHVFERMVVYFYISQGIAVSFADNPKNMGKLITDVKPTCMTVVPRVLEKIYAAMISNVEAAGMFRRPIGRLALKLAHSQIPSKSSLRLRQSLAHKLVFSRMRRALGGELRIVICGGSKLSPQLCQFFWNIGIPTYQGYGLTETSPVICANYPGHNRIGTVGRPFPLVEVKISDGGEVLTRGPHVMAGYHNNPTVTQQTIDADGYLHTGDLGRIDADGYLTITGRIKELYKTAGGKYVCPAPIEIALTASPFIDRAYVVAEGKRYPSCVLFADTLQARKILGLPELAQLPDEQLLVAPQFTEQIQQLIKWVNDNLDPWEQIGQYRLIADELTVENGGLTPTQKIRRSCLDDRYKDLINSMYIPKGPTS